MRLSKKAILIREYNLRLEIFEHKGKYFICSPSTVYDGYTILGAYDTLNEAEIVFNTQIDKYENELKQ
jgi:hypothetical protein